LVPTTRIVLPQSHAHSHANFLLMRPATLTATRRPNRWPVMSFIGGPPRIGCS